MKKQESSNQETMALTKSQGTAAATQNLDEWGAGPKLSQKDVLVSKIHLMQGLSKKVAAGEAKMGELRDSVTNALYGDYKTAMEFIPFHMQNLWIEEEHNGKKYEYKRTVNIDESNDDLAYDDGKTKRTRTMNFYVLLPSEIAEGREIPRIISFASTSRRAGQKLATQMFVTNRAQSKSPAATVMSLSVRQESNNNGTFAVKDCATARAATQQELDSALKWFKVVRGPNNLKVDEEIDLDMPAVDDLGDTGNF